MEGGRNARSRYGQRIPLVLNPRAGRHGSDPGNALESLVEQIGVDVDIHRVEPSQIERTIQGLVRDGAPAVGVCGGDGSIRAAASQLMGTPTALLPIPTGTLNHFCRRLGINTPEEALAALQAGRVITVPVGLVDERVFLNTATIGLYADVVRVREKLRVLLSKWPAAVLASCGMLVRLRHFEMLVHAEGEPLHRSTPLLWMGLGRGSFPMVTEAEEHRPSPDLEMVILRPRGRAGAVALLARLLVHWLRGRHPREDPALEMLHARRLLIHSPHRLGITLDGEVLRSDSPVFVSVQDHALRVVAPVA